MYITETKAAHDQSAKLQDLICVIEDNWLQAGEDPRLEKIRRFTDFDPSSTASFTDLLLAGQCPFRLRSFIMQWESLNNSDRLTVLDTYCRLFRQEIQGLTTLQKTLFFWLMIYDPAGSDI